MPVSVKECQYKIHDFAALGPMLYAPPQAEAGPPAVVGAVFNGIVNRIAGKIRQ